MGTPNKVPLILGNPHFTWIPKRIPSVHFDQPIVPLAPAVRSFRTTSGWPFLEGYKVCFTLLCSFDFLWSISTTGAKGVPFCQRRLMLDSGKLPFSRLSFTQHSLSDLVNPHEPPKGPTPLSFQSSLRLCLAILTAVTPFLST